jgi:hypothetical protein
MHEKPLEFGHIHENITYFCIFEMSKNKIWIFWIFQYFGEKSSIFNIESVSYSVILQPNIIWNYRWKTYFNIFLK